MCGLLSNLSFRNISACVNIYGNSDNRAEKDSGVVPRQQTTTTSFEEFCQFGHRSVV